MVRGAFRRVTAVCRVHRSRARAASEMSVGHWCADSAKRLFRELRVLNEGLANDPTEVELYACDDVDLSRWIGIIPGACARVNARNQERVTKLSLCVSFKTGPKHTPYEGGRFKVDIQIPAHYPLCPPRVTFLTRSGTRTCRAKMAKCVCFAVTGVLRFL